MCSFFANSLGNPDIEVPGADGVTCQTAYDVAETIPEDDGCARLAAIDDHHAWKEWVDFDGLSVVSVGAGDANADRIAAGSGRIRVDGMSNSAIRGCLDLSELPYRVEFDPPFSAMEADHFRNHFYYQSFTRDRAGHAALLWVVARGVALLVGAIVGRAAHAADRRAAGRSRTVCCRSVTRSSAARVVASIEGDLRA